VPSTLLLGVVQPQESTIETPDSPDKQIDGANGILRGCMRFYLEPPLHLLRQAWNQTDCPWMSLDSLDGFLSNVAMLTLKVYAKINRHPAHLIKYLEAFMPNDGHKAQSKRCRQYSRRDRPKGVITRHFHNMAQN
jgi:hypothetical protein